MKADSKGSYSRGGEDFYHLPAFPSARIAFAQSITDRVMCSPSGTAVNSCSNVLPGFQTLSSSLTYAMLIWANKVKQLSLPTSVLAQHALLATGFVTSSCVALVCMFVATVYHVHALLYRIDDALSPEDY